MFTKNVTSLGRKNALNIMVFFHAVSFYGLFILFKEFGHLLSGFVFLILSLTYLYYNVKTFKIIIETYKWYVLWGVISIVLNILIIGQMKDLIL